MMLSLVISTHALREEGDPNLPAFEAWQAISTHALREEGDGSWGRAFPVR